MLTEERKNIMATQAHAVSSGQALKKKIFLNSAMSYWFDCRPWGMVLDTNISFLLHFLPKTGGNKTRPGADKYRMIDYTAVHALAARGCPINLGINTGFPTTGGSGSGLKVCRTERMCGAGDMVRMQKKPSSSTRANRLLRSVAGSGWVVEDG